MAVIEYLLIEIMRATNIYLRPGLGFLSIQTDGCSDHNNYLTDEILPAKMLSTFSKTSKLP